MRKPRSNRERTLNALAHTRRLKALVVFMCLAAFAVSSPEENERCMRCHGETWILERRPEALAAMVRAPENGERTVRAQEDIPRLFVPSPEWEQSAHAKLSCDQCHPGIETLPHYQQVETLDCMSCHAGEVRDMERGRHASSIPNTPNCAHCHGEAHAVEPVDVHRTYEAAVAMVERCSECHSDLGKGRFSPAGTFHDSIHGDALFKKGLVSGPLCSDCHGAHAVLPPSDPKSPISTQNASETCGTCHQGVEDTYLTSIHGQRMLAGHEDAATCTSCHHSHGVQKVGPRFLSKVVEECSHCHLDLGKSYVLSYHGKASTLGSDDVAVCSSCHGAHDILPAEDPHSRVSEENLIETCGECHPGANENFVQYIAHVDYTSREKNPIVFYAFWGMTLLLCSVLAVFIPHTLLWFQRTLPGRLFGPKQKEPEKVRMIRRFSPLHRFTHALIIVSFMGLVATGFPLKYSYANWAHDISAIFGGIHVMGILHRIFAIITFAYAGVHFAWLAYFFTCKCPKPRWRYIIGPDSMLFSWRDFKDFIAMMRWFLRLGPRPRLDRWAYFEKFDYFGEIWGVFVIGGTGLMLWLPTLFTKWMPGWVLNVAMVIHSIEALLAASVIFLVHFFNTHLRPEKFPIDLTMWSGQISEEEMKHERGAEYDRLVESGQLEERVEEPISRAWRITGTILGMTAFLIGIVLIVLAIRTEILNITGMN